MSAPSLSDLATEAKHVRSQCEVLRYKLGAHPAFAADVGLLFAVDLLLASVAAGLRLAADPRLRASTAAKLERDAAERRAIEQAAVAADPRA